MPRSTRRNRPPAFTLLEVLAAAAVLSLLALMIVHITSAVNLTTRVSNHAIDASAQARLAFERIGADLSKLVKRPDVDFHAANTGTGETLLFLSNVPAPDPASAASGYQNRNAAYVGYQVAAHPDNGARPCLIRGSRALGWSDAGFGGLKSDGLALGLKETAFPATLLPQAPSSAAPGDYDLIAPGVIRIVAGFQLYPDNRIVSLQDGTTLAAAQGQVVYSPPLKAGSAAAAIDLTRVSAIVVGIVAADVESLRRLSADQIAALASPFTVPALNQLPAEAWAAAASTVSGAAGLPLAALQSRRVYQCFFPVTPFPTQPK